MRFHRGLIVFLVALGLCRPVSAEGKISFGTGQGVGIKVSIPFGPSDTYRVKRVVDGDTVEMEDGEVVRYLGIDAPETYHREGGKWVYAPQPLSEEAADFNRQLVEGKEVRLEYDQRKTDRFGRLLAYVFVKMDLTEPAFYDNEVFLDSHEIFVNAYLLREGYAKLKVLKPNTAHAKHLERMEAEAKEARRNLWAEGEPLQGEVHAGKR